MDATSSEYEFLDLTDINDEDRNSLTSALFAPAPNSGDSNWSPGDRPETQIQWPDTNFDLSSCSSGTPGPPTQSSSLDSLPTTEREMAPHSPQRNAPPQGAVPPVVPPNPTLAYSQPPPHLYPAPNPHQHWPQHVMPPNVYVSQVTANVNVHGYMGQYYQPQFVSHPSTEQRGRDGRDRGKGRRGGGVKRTQSPSYLPQSYPQFYPTPQTAQGAPLYQMPIYSHPMGYVSYPYMPYMDYGIIEDPNQSEKGPEEYPPEMMIEPEQHLPHDVYYHPHPSCVPQSAMYDPNRPMEGPCSMEPYPQFYQLLYPSQAPPVHQFNVHAKNFVRQNDHKNYVQQSNEIKIHENVNQMKNNHQGQGSNVNNAVDALPVKDLKISPTTKPAMIPKQILEKPNVNQQAASKPIIMTSDKVAPKPQSTDIPKPAWTGNISKNTDNSNNNKGLPLSINTPAPVVSVNKSINLSVNKVSKNTTPVPFVNNTFVKGGPPQQMTQVIMPQHDLPAKAPFTRKHKKEPTVKIQEITEQQEVPQPPPTNAPVAEIKQNSTPKPTVPVAIPVQATTSITSKAPFSHARKSSVSSQETPAVATPPAPTASDFPPPPPPRRSVDQPPATQPPVTQPLPSGNKTWASLFLNSTASAPAQNDEPANQQVATNTVLPNSTSNQRPIAKVGPFDSSPLQNEVVEKPTNNSMNSYEKPLNSTQNQRNINNKENPKDNINMNSSTNHTNDPNSYRMGEFLAKYQLNHHTISLQPRGLSNRSNYCYINAILQALVGCPPFYNMLKSMPYQLKKGKSNTPIIDAMVELCGEFSPLPPGSRVTRPERGARNSPATATAAEGEQTPVAPPVNVGPVFEPSTVLHMLREMNNGESFRVEGRQEDAEEFLGCLLNGLNDEMLELIKLVEPEDPKDVPVVVNGNDAGQESEDDDAWKVMGRKNKGSVERRCSAGRTPLSDIFRGQLRSRLQRATDTTTTDTTHCVQPFFTLPLDIERSNSVREALERVAGKDRLEGVTCPSKGRPVEAWQQVLLEQLPAVLILHLKCFHSRPADGATVKIVKTIDYPVDLKIDTKIISKVKCNTKQRSYKLFAVVYHEGSEAEKGHYLTDVYHVGCGGWLRYDDSVVTSVTEQQVLYPRLPRTPYLLLYRRQDTMQGPRHQQPI